MALLAQNPIPLNQSIGGAGLGPFGAAPATSGTEAVNQITKVVSDVIGFLTITAGLWLLFQLLFGGYEWISSAGDSKKLAAARQRIMNGVFGLIIVVGAWAMIALVGQFLGYDILNPAANIGKLQF